MSGFEFRGSMLEGAKVEVDGNALMRLLNAFGSGQTHRVLEFWATMGLPGNDIGKLVEDFRMYVDKEDGTPAEKQVILPSGQEVTPQKPDELALADLVAATKEQQVGVLNDFVGDMMNIAEVYPTTFPIRNRVPEIDIADTYPKEFPSGFKEGEIVKRKDGQRFFLGETKFVDDAVLVKSCPQHGLLFLGSTSDFSITWTAPIELLNDVESTGVCVDENSLKHLKIAYDVLVGNDNE